MALPFEAHEVGKSPPDLTRRLSEHQVIVIPIDKLIDRLKAQKSSMLDRFETLGASGHLPSRIQLASASSQSSSSSRASSPLFPCRSDCVPANLPTFDHQTKESSGRCRAFLDFGWASRRTASGRVPDDEAGGSATFEFGERIVRIGELKQDAASCERLSNYPVAVPNQSPRPA
jgi:hypothetical protein